LKAFCTRFFVNALLIPRARPKDGADTPNPIQLMIDILDKGESIIIFPEGSRGDPDVMQKFKKGIGCVLQQRPHIPYIPTYMKGMGKVLPKGEMLLVPFNTFVTFGKAQFTQTTVIEDIVAEVEVHIKSLQQPT
jgi:1-acyl-sn-glycerol-3-phosphate acyltransferase